MIQIHPNMDSLSRAAAALFVQRAQQSVEARGRFTVALSGGQTPRRAYELLAQSPLREQIPWRAVHVFWGDERFTPPGDPQSCEHMARLLLLDHVPIPRSQIHPIRSEQSAEQAARRYEELLRAFFSEQPPRFDLIFLGMGENGHIASLFPGTPALEERERWVVVVHLGGLNLDRITLTPPIINQAAAVAFLVSGASKAQAIGDVLHGPPDPRRLPAQLIRPLDGELSWLVDREAASLLPLGRH